jgi:trans-2,3-dihydro-3-hydroxyanthranilate isomerase
MSGSYEFVQLDVFTRTALTGNPLAIFTDARGLTDQQMQALAREMNLSETTFVLPREPQVEAQEGKRVRIFTVEEELPFAGHPFAEFVNVVDNKASVTTGKFVEEGRIPYTGKTGNKIIGVDFRAIAYVTNWFDILASFNMRYRYVFSFS